MTRPQLSRAAAGLLRALLARAGNDRDKIYLTKILSVDWQSLTFSGERHRISLRLCAPLAPSLLARLTDSLADAEWRLPGQTVADIAVEGMPATMADGSIILNLEALTIAE